MKNENKTNKYRSHIYENFSAPLPEIRQTFSGLFEEDACIVGAYELADRCPILVFRPRK